MYTSIRNRPAQLERGPAGRRARIGANVVLLGLTSLFTDISQEMVTSILPLYLAFELRLSPLQLGLVDGSYQGATALLRMVGGFIADRRRRHKEVAAAGYGISAACKLGLLATAGAWLPTMGMLMVDRLGKGIRTAPRDALISLSSDRGSLGAAFGVHRALDTTGALIGPFVAFAILGAIPFAYDAVFVTSFCFALVGLAVILLFVRNQVGRAEARPDHLSPRRIMAMLGAGDVRRIAVVGGLLSLLTIGDAFVYLLLQADTGLSHRWFPLLFVGTAAAYLVLAVPLGRVADRVGRHRVFIAGHIALLAVYGLLLAGDISTVGALLILGLYGSYYAATDGVLMALASVVLPEGVRTSGLALVTTVVALARFAAALVFGAIWTQWGATPALTVVAIGLLIALPVAGRVLRPGREATA